MLGRLIPFGYATPDAQARLEALMQDEKAVLVDIRYNPVSRWRPMWNKKALSERWGGRYSHVKLLGNVNYNNGGPIQIANAERGIPLVVQGLQRGLTIILLCVCKEYSTCHRRVVCDMVKEKLPGVEIVGGWECLRCRLEVTLGEFFAAFEQYVKSLVFDHWIWGELSNGLPVTSDNTLSRETTQSEKDEIVADIFANYDDVVQCHEWVQVEHYTTIDGKELDGPVNVLVQSWDNKRV